MYLSLIIMYIIDLPFVISYVRDVVSILSTNRTNIYCLHIFHVRS